MNELIEPSEVCLCFIVDEERTRSSCWLSIIGWSHDRVRALPYPEDVFMSRSRAAPPLARVLSSKFPLAQSTFIKPGAELIVCEGENKILVFAYLGLQEKEAGSRSCVIDPLRVALCRQHNLCGYVTDAIPPGVLKLPTSTAPDT